MLFGMSVSAAPRRHRVRALAPDERREALIAATVPLLREHGVAVSTRQIADAAGVAEGTIFGVFPDKASLIRAAVIRAFDPGPVVASLAGVEVIPTLPRVRDLRRRLEAVTQILWYRTSCNAPLVTAFRTTAYCSEGGPPAEVLAARERILDAIAAVIEPDAALLRRGPATIARLLLLMVFATGSGSFGESEPFDAGEIVSLLFDGLLVRPQSHPSRGESSC
jgi:AcrR family transcriptional regulator